MTIHIEIIAIGNEILSGRTINSNASYLSKKLQSIGYQSFCHLVLPDDFLILLKQLQSAFERSDVVICSGGLGPTFDDLTKDVIAKLFNLKQIIDPKIEENLKKRFPKYEAIDKDALVLENAKIFCNNVGTAPGLVVEKNSKALILLPGVPSELKPMFDENVIPYLKKHFPTNDRIYQKEIGLFLMQETKINAFLEKFQQKFPKLKIGIYPSLGYITVSIVKVLTDSDNGHEEVDLIIENIKATFLENWFEQSIEHTLHKVLSSKKITLAFAESCTGGSLASTITKIPDASKYFHGSIVSYSNAMKINHLHVNKHTLDKYGAVSLEVVLEMLEGVLENTGVDYAVATSGIAGPSGGTEKKPVGTVCLGWANRMNQNELHTFHFSGNRQKIIENSVNVALAMLLKKVKYNAYTFKR